MMQALQSPWYAAAAVHDHSATDLDQSADDREQLCCATSVSVIEVSAYNTSACIVQHNPNLIKKQCGTLAIARHNDSLHLLPCYRNLFPTLLP